MRILVVEDDERTSEYVRRGLIEAGHVVDSLEDGREALGHASTVSFDVIVVDRMLPGLDGLSLVKGLRAMGTTTPVLFLTAVNGVDDRVEGLESGGDDYLVKPFAFSELLARLNALARRPPPQIEKTVLQVAELELDLVRRSCKRGRAVDRPPASRVRPARVPDAQPGPSCHSNHAAGTSLGFFISIRRPALWKLILVAFVPRWTSRFSAALIHTVRHIGYSMHA